MGTRTILKIFSQRFSSLILVLCLSACVGTGGEGSSAPLGGPVGPAPGPGGLPSISGDPVGSGHTATGETEVAMGAPEMPDVPVAPQTDVVQPEFVAKPVEYRIEGQILSVCLDPNGESLEKNFSAQLLCRWEGSNDPFIPCGKGRHLRIFDPVTHHYVDVQTNLEDARFEWSFRFNTDTNDDQALGSEPWQGYATSQWAAQNDQHKDSVAYMAYQGTVPAKDNAPTIENSIFVSPGVKGGIGDQIDDLFGEPYDEADKELSSDESDLLFFAFYADGIPPMQLGVQKYCNFPKMCEPGSFGQLGRFISLGELILDDLALTGLELPDSLPACPLNP